MCDGYSGYNKVPDAKRTACWAHIRRYLTDAIPKGKPIVEGFCRDLINRIQSVDQEWIRQLPIFRIADPIL